MLPLHDNAVNGHTSPRPKHHLTEMAESDPTKLPTPSSCIAGKEYMPRQRRIRKVLLTYHKDFCLIPIGTPTASVSKEVAQVQRLLRNSGVKHIMHSAGTTVGKPTRHLNPY